MLLSDALFISSYFSLKQTLQFYYLIFLPHGTFFDILLIFVFVRQSYLLYIAFDNLSFFVFYLLSKTYIYFLHVLVLILCYLYNIPLICLTAHLYYFFSIPFFCLILYLCFFHNNLFYSFIYLKNKNKKTIYVIL